MTNTDTSYNEPTLLEQMAAGDKAAFTAIYNKYWNKLYFLAHKHLKSPAASEEIVQEVFLQLWKKREVISIHSLPVYLAAMTRYAVYRNLARQKKQGLTNIDSAASYQAAGGLAEDMDNRMLLELIEKLSSLLPEKCRLVFIKNKLLDQPLDQVAEDMGISTKTAEAHLTKALKSIRGGLGDALSILFIV